MNKFILLTTLVLTVTSLQAQKKKDLLAEIDKLRNELRTTKNELAETSKQISVAESKAKSMEAQVKSLKETNESLLANMGSFTELSKKKAENSEKLLKTVQEKDKQLKTINDEITKKDSINLAALTIFKDKIGGDANITVKQGVVYMVIPNANLFGDPDKSYKLEDKAKGVLGKIAGVLNQKKDLHVIVEGNSNALKFDGKPLSDNWDLSSLQAAAVARALQKDFKVDPKRIEVVGKSEYGMESIETVTRIIIDPNFDNFYQTVKNNMKNDKG
ncbi:OmpA/MotB family protein [Aquimarina brevivitae]|uniref:Chemotaxis protein MotB n=1 Tax=Aquimarina brevivitae TaxID=323412 RepID=A0A4Q7P0V5_9FLAO|nr:OmpA family protein [Aquimarina brevivitae]RZS93304.1 chemotaxis protein MotB [Aquimarina brevivitae]